MMSWVEQPFNLIIISLHLRPNRQTFHRLLLLAFSIIDSKLGHDSGHCLVMPRPALLASISLSLRQVPPDPCGLHRFRNRIFTCFSLAFSLQPVYPGTRRHARPALAWVSTQGVANSPGSFILCTLNHVLYWERLRAARALSRYRVAQMDLS